ncbi:MAG: RNA-guided pseudouridylation complex pseudouridine synthase subunit Cbf5 [Haloarculaceae archaeon]
MTLRDPPSDRSLDDLLTFGVVNLDKPPGPSAHQVAGWVRDLAGVDRAAHAGTLDPKVTGCLPVMLGDATRLAPVFLEGRKEYVAVLELHGRPPADLADVVAEFEGEIYQKPPRKSAVARRLRTRTVHALDVLETRDRQVLLRIECASGTYVRKLCHDLGLALGTGAHMGDLRRTATAPFDDRDLVTLHDLADALAFAEEDDEEPLREVVAPGERILEDLPAVTVAPSAAEQVAEGAPVYAPGVLHADPADRDALVACVTPDGSAVCLGRLVGAPDADEGTVVDLERVLV